MTLHFYILTTPTIPERVKNITQVIQWVKQQCDAVGFATKFHTLSQPTAEYMHDMVRAKNTTMEERIQPKSNNPHPVYAKFETPLNTAELSNYERHRTALDVIRKGSHDDYYFVLEDDVYIIPLFEAAWGEMLKHLKSSASSPTPAPAMVLFSITRTMQNDEPFAFLPYATMPLTEEHPLIPSKEMYMIHPTAAGQLYDYMHLIHCDARHTFSRWIYTNLPLHNSIYLPSKRLTFDGSKLGMFPSSIHANNLLVFNKEFMEMLQLLSNPNKDKATAARLYKAIERLQSPDAMHLYAVLMYQLGDLEEADAYFKKAIQTIETRKGFISRGSELLYNAIEFYKHYQKEELESIASKPSKYHGTFA